MYLGTHIWICRHRLAKSSTREMILIILQYVDSNLTVDNVTRVLNIIEWRREWHFVWFIFFFFLLTFLFQSVTIIHWWYGFAFNHFSPATWLPLSTKQENWYGAWLIKCRNLSKRRIKIFCASSSRTCIKDWKHVLCRKCFRNYWTHSSSKILCLT